MWSRRRKRRRGQRKKIGKKSIRREGSVARKEIIEHEGRKGVG